MTDDERDSFLNDIPDPPMHYDRDGQPISLRTWADLHADPEYRVVEETWIGKIRISTVWLGINHDYLGGPPLIYETMVFDWHNPTTIPGFGDREFAPDLEMVRYTTLAQAETGHEQMVAIVMATTPDESRIDVP